MYNTKRIVLLFIMCLLDYSSKAQCTVLKITFDDCQACRGSFEKFDPRVTNLPAYVIFPTNKRADSADIEYIGRFGHSGIIAIYNDAWYNKMNALDKRSCAIGLDKFGHIVYQTSLSKINESQMKDFLNKNAPGEASKEEQFITYRDSLKYMFDLGLGSLTIMNSKDDHVVGRIKSSNINLDVLKAKMTGVKKDKFEKYGYQLNTQLTEFIAKYKSFQLTPEGDIIMELLYHSTPDSLSNNITDEHCFLKFSPRGVFKDVALLNHKPGMVIYDFSFMMDDKEAIYLNTCSLSGFKEDLQKGAKTLNYVTHFEKKKGNYEFVDYVPFELPYIYKTRYYENDLSSNCSDYPYISNSLGNEIYNLKNKAEINVLPDSLYRYNVDKNKVFKFDREDLYSYCLKYDRDKKQLILPYRLKNKLYVNYYSDDLKLIHSAMADLGFIPASKIKNVFLNPPGGQAEIVYWDNEHNARNLFIPLDLLSKYHL